METTITTFRGTVYCCYKRIIRDGWWQLEKLASMVIVLSTTLSAVDINISVTI